MQRIKEIVTRMMPKSVPTGTTQHPTIYPDDCFLVSYPKSGNTWMRFLLAQLLYEAGGGKDHDLIDFHNYSKYVPEYELHSRDYFAMPRPHIIKSHSPYNPDFPRVVYLVRDPRDVYVSYYHYMLKRLPEGTSFHTFLRMDSLDYGQWHEHVAGWIDKPNVMVIRYEDMLRDTAVELKRCIDFWGGLTFSDSQIQRAVELSRFDRMKQIEQQRGLPFRNPVQKAKSTTFMRKGRSGDWVNYFDEADLAYLISRCGRLMARLGYSDTYTCAKAG
ncbi:MAG: sulfotransferase domain-containing protein [Phycisphaeraceae bacterium]